MFFSPTEHDVPAAACDRRGRDIRCVPVRRHGVGSGCWTERRGRVAVWATGVQKQPL